MQVPALEVIQPGLYGAYLAVRAKLGGKELEITGAKEADFYRPGRGVTSPGFDCGNTLILSLYASWATRSLPYTGLDCCAPHNISGHVMGLLPGSSQKDTADKNPDSKTEPC